MANTTAPRSANYNGWFYDAVTPAQKFYNRGTLVLTIASNDLTCADTITTVGTVTIGAYTLPATDGANTNVPTTNGSGVVAWA